MDIVIPMVDLRRQHAPILEDLRAAFERVVGASAFILGEEVERFEREFALYCGVRECVGVASGTAALTIALKALGVGPGDEVIVPAQTFIASALSVAHAGAVPRFCDVDETTGLIDLGSAASVVFERTAAVMPVHLYGQMCDMEAVDDFATRHGLAVVEDAAHAHGATFQGKRAGSFGAAAAFSFYPGKNLGALGDGGAVCTDDPVIAERARQLRHLGQRAKGEHVVLGFNERLDGLQAAFLRVKLPHLERWNERRRGHAATYREALPQEVSTLTERPYGQCVYHLFPIRVSERERLREALATAGVQTGIHYAPAVHDQPPFASGRPPTHDLPTSRRWAAETLSLPLFPELEREEIERAAEVVASTVGAVGAGQTRPG